MHQNRARRGSGNRGPGSRGASNRGFGQDRHGLLGDSPGTHGRKKGHGGPGLLGSAPTPEMLGMGGRMHGMGDTGQYDDEYNKLSYGTGSGVGGGSGGMGRGMGRGNRQGLLDGGQFENRQMGGRPGLLDNISGSRGGLLDDRNFVSGTRGGLLDDRNLSGTRGGLLDDRNLSGTRGGLLDDRNLGGSRGGLLDNRNMGGNRGSLLDDRNIGSKRGGHFEDRNIGGRSSLLDDRPARGGLLDNMPRGGLLDDRGMPNIGGDRRNLLDHDHYDSGGLLDRDPLVNRRTLLSDNQEVQHLLNVQQQQIAALKDSQLQMVSNLLQQQGGAGILPHQQPNIKSSLLGSPGGGMGRGNLLGSGTGRGSLLGPGGAGMGRGGRDGIPSIFDIEPNSKGGSMQLGKRGMRDQRDGGMGAGPHKRMRRDMRGGHQSSRGSQRNQDRHFRRDNDKRDDRSRDRPVSGGRHSDRSPSTHSSRDRNRSGGRKDEKKDIKKEIEKKEETKNDGKKEDDEKEDTQNDNHNAENKDEEMADVEDAGDKKDDMETSDTSLTVTIDKSGRSVNDPQRKKSDSESDGKKTNFYCHACAVDCRNETSFTNHMKGNRHRDRMNMLLNLHQKKSYELADRMKAEEHLRKIEGKPRTDYCRICDVKFDGTFQQHRQTREHKKKIEKDKSLGKEHSEEEDEEFTDNFVTVDTIGYDDDEVINMDADGDKALGKFKVDIDFIVPDYDPKKPLGQNFIVPVSGYFCKLCHKFYNNEEAAKVTHCQSQPHYDKFQKMMLAKKLSQKMEKEKQAADIKEEQKESTKAANENDTESKQSATTETIQSKTTNGNIDQSVNVETETEVGKMGDAEIKPEEDVAIDSNVDSSVPMDTNADSSVAEEENEEDEDASPKSKAKGSTRGRGKQRARRGKKV